MRSALLLLLAALASAQRPAALRDVGIDQRLNEAAPLHTVFRDEAGRSVELGEYFGRRPVILALVYYECPMLCSQVLNGLVRSLRAVPFRAGEEFEVAVVSFDPAETPALAAAARRAYSKRYAGHESGAGWHFLTGEDSSIRTLTEAAGFRYRYDAGSKQFAHASGILVLTPQGRISRYFYGVDYSPKELRLALVEAARGRIGSVVDQILLFCYHYDPASGKYTLAVMNVLRALALATVAGLAGLVWWMRRREQILPQSTRRTQRV